MSSKPRRALGARRKHAPATELQEALAELERARDISRRNAALLRAISDTSTDAIFARDLLGRVLFASPAALALVGEPRGEDDPEAARLAMERDLRIMESGTATEMEEIVAQPDGTERVWHSRKMPFFDETRRVVGLLGIARDITERRRAEQHVRESSAKLQAALASMTDAVFISDAEGRFVDFNDAFATFHKFRSKEECAKTFGEYPEIFDVSLADGTSAPVEEWAVPRALRGETATNAIYGLARKDTGERWIGSYSFGPIRDESGAIVGSVVVGRDVTDARRAEEALRESEERYRSLFENLLDGYAYCRILFDAEGRPEDFVYLAVNAAFERLTGLKDVVGRKVSEVIPGLHEREPALLERYARVAATRRPERFEIYIGPLGIWLAISVYSPAKDHFVAVFDNITERKSSEEERERLVAALREADRRKNEFLAVLSHELRNPLAPIRSSAYILERAVPGSEPARRALQVIDRQAQQMARLIDDLLDVERITRGKVTLKRERLDLAALARATGEDHRDLFERSGVALAAGGFPGPLWVYADRARLAQVIGNLLMNAVKFTPRGGRTEIAVEESEGRAIVRVRDTGTGMSRETLSRIFEPFVQADQTLDRSRGGLGLGLALVKGLAEMHGGIVSARSDGVGKGSELAVTLPLASPADVRRNDGRVPAPVARARRVLVIEDNEDAAESLREALELGDHEVAVASSGPEGIEAARAFRPEVVLCDIGLPGLDGYGVARAMRADPCLKSAFLVALSGYALKEDVAKAEEAGFDRHMAKPPSIDGLMRLLDEVPGAAG